MKMALCLYGQARTFEFCEQSLHRHLIEKYDPDIFLCSDDSVDKLSNTYDPVGIEILSPEKQLNAIGDRVHRYGETVPNPGPYKNYPIRPAGDLMLIYKMWRCREMLRNHEAKHGNYDIVVGTRFDAKFLNIQPITLPVKNTFYIPRVDAFGKAAVNGIHWGMGYCTHIWWADSITGCFMLNSYNWSDDYYKITGKWGGEGMTKGICDKLKIDIQYTDVTFMLIRGTSDRPREGLPPWNLLSKKVHPEYMAQEWEKKKKAPKKREPPHADGFYW